MIIKLAKDGSNIHYSDFYIELAASFQQSILKTD